MKYHESIAQANEVMSQVLGFLQQHSLAANPINYTVAYEHVSGKNSTLSLMIEKRVHTGKALDNYVMEMLYADLVLKQNEIQAGIVEHLDSILEGIDDQSVQARASISGYLEHLDHTLIHLDGDDVQQSKRVINQLVHATNEMKKNQCKLQEKLLASCAQTEHLRMELDELQRQRNMDTLTGMKNSNALQEQMDMWLTEHPQRKIAAIAIDIDHFSGFNDRYGYLVGDVILSKVARKISHYVKDSGLPVRVGGEAFLILLPDVDLHTASEVAEQVRKGVEKMKFVSSRSKRALPNVTISIGTSSYRSNEPLDQFVLRADSALLHAKACGHNKVISEMVFS